MPTTLSVPKNRAVMTLVSSEILAHPSFRRASPDRPGVRLLAEMVGKCIARVYDVPVAPSADGVEKFQFRNCGATPATFGLRHGFTCDGHYPASEQWKARRLPPGELLALNEIDAVEIIAREALAVSNGARGVKWFKRERPFWLDGDLTTPPLED